MLNITPLDYERYAALYGPPPPPVASNFEAAVSRNVVDRIEPVNSDPGRRGLAAGDKIGTTDSFPTKSPLAVDGNDPEYPLNGLLPTDVRAFIELSGNFQNSTPAQLGLTPEKVTGLYDRQIEDPGGSLRIVT